MSQLSTNMIECPICNFHYSGSLRIHCPTCGCSSYRLAVIEYNSEINGMVFKPIVVAHGAERARQLPQSPRVFQLVD